ncbi:hypothetical protein AAY473_026837 [Plecturocebus cupreus]
MGKRWQQAWGPSWERGEVVLHRPQLCDVSKTRRRKSTTSNAELVTQTCDFCPGLSVVGTRKLRDVLSPTTGRRGRGSVGIGQPACGCGH